MTEVLEKEQKVETNRKPISICVMSDLHGNLPDINPVDLVLLCGDQVSLKAQGSSDKTKKWYLKEFIPWVDKLPCDKVLFIAGNHELHFYKDKLWIQEMFNEHSKATYLENDYYEYKSLKIFGSPYCKEFGEWAFMYPDDILREYFSEIPNDLDILITHDAPFGVSDILLEEDCYFYSGMNIGNKPLREAIESRNIKYNFHGHLHSTNHLEEYLNNTIVRNASILNERYEIYYNPIYITI